MPDEVIARRGLPPLAEASRLVHIPLTVEDTRRGMAHLRYEEAFILQAIFAQRRAQDERTPPPSSPLKGRCSLCSMSACRSPSRRGSERSAR